MSKLTLQKGQTLGGVVSRYNRAHGTHLTVAQVAKANGIRDPNKVQAGRQLRFNDTFKPTQNPQRPVQKPKLPEGSTDLGGGTWRDKSGTVHWEYPLAA